MDTNAWNVGSIQLFTAVRFIVAVMWAFNYGDIFTSRRGKAFDLQGQIPPSNNVKNALG